MIYMNKRKEDGMSKRKLAAIIIACTIVIIVIVVIATRPPAQFNTYSKYGFSFEYPKAFYVTEMGALESEANDSSGVVEFLVENGEPEFCYVGWTATTPGETESWEGGVEGYLKNQIEVTIAVLEVAGNYTTIGSFAAGELLESTKAGHLMFYQYVDYTPTEGDRVYGAISFFYCDESQKLFSLMTASMTTTTEEDGLENFQNYLDSFVCH
jgi:hypothetical protein